MKDWNLSKLEKRCKFYSQYDLARTVLNCWIRTRIDTSADLKHSKLFLYEAFLWILIGFSADSDRAFYLNADPDPGSQTNADPDPVQA
jgi:hypothetical protein